MKKRILSIVLAFVMMTVLISSVFAAPLDIEDTADAVYEGNKPFELSEKILDELNEDKEAALFDDVMHDAQFDIIENINLSLGSANMDDAIDHLTSNMSNAQKMYLYAQVRAESDDSFKLELDAVDPVGGLPLRESFDLLDNYINDMMVFLNAKGISAADYNNSNTVQQNARAIVAEPLIAILKVMFAQDGTATDTSEYIETGKYMRENYLKEFIENDRAKKTLSVLFGAKLTEEIVKDSFLSGVSNSNPNETVGIVHHVKKYLEENNNAIRNLKNEIENRVLVANGLDSVEAAFDVLGDLVVKAYQHDTNATDDLKEDVKMLMGDGNIEGLLEKMIKAVDNPQLDASNIWLNLFLSEFVQMKLVNGPLNTICAANPNQKVNIRDNASVAFKNERLQDYGIDDGAIALGTGCFNLVCYNADGTENSYVTYDGEKIQITEDSLKGAEYDAYFVLYRSSTGSDEDTFIESYPVTIVNEEVTERTPSGTSRYLLKYETNGGNTINSESYTRGTTVALTKVPVKEGYIFSGWYLDEALTQKVESIVMNGSKTVYAAWVKDGSTVVSKVDVPSMLNGDEHFAYVIGYPEGDVRPQNNITRAEAVTILFRLLKDEVRDQNLATENIFTDVNSGDWYNTAVSTLAALNIVNGRTETEFMPNEYITRAEFATIFARFAEYSYEPVDQFTDIIGHWAEDNIREATAYGWIAGYENNTFRPDNRITRAEAMTLINRVLKRVPQNKDDLLEGMNVWSDNADTSAWYYIAIQEATNSHEFTMKNDVNETWTKLTANKDWTKYEN